jgi:hypothetical protein
MRVAMGALGQGDLIYAKNFPTYPNKCSTRFTNCCCYYCNEFGVKFQLSPTYNLRGAVNVLEKGELIYGGVRPKKFTISSQ